IAGVTVFGYRLTNDDLEIGLAVFPVAHIAAIEADHDATFRDGQPGPIRRAAIDEAGPLLSEFGLGALGHTQDVLAQRGGVGTRRDREDVSQQTGRGSVGHERRPARLKVEPLRSDIVGDQVAQRQHRSWAVRALAGAAMQSRAGNPNIAIERHEDDGRTAFAMPARATRFAAAMLLRP